MVNERFYAPILTRHASTIRENTVITAERDRGRCFVRTRTVGVVTLEIPAQSETQARERFERAVENHYEEGSK